MHELSSAAVSHIPWAKWSGNKQVLTQSNLSLSFSYFKLLVTTTAIFHRMLQNLYLVFLHFLKIFLLQEV